MSTFSVPAPLHSLLSFCNPAVYLLQEFCDQGTLANLAATKWLPEQEGDEQMLRRLVLRDAARGLQALHAACVVHGDLVRGRFQESSFGIDVCHERWFEGCAGAACSMWCMVTWWVAAAACRCCILLEVCLCFC
jgi:hypothetical protein